MKLDAEGKSPTSFRDLLSVMTKSQILILEENDRILALFL